MENKHLRRSSLLRPLLATAVASLASSGFAADGTWDVDQAGNWSDIANWNAGAGPVADGATFTATFSADLTANRIITLDSARTIGHLSFADTVPGSSRTFTISGANTLTLDADGLGGGTSIINVATGTGAVLSSTMVLAGSGNIEKTGGGSLSLATSNAGGTFTGSLTVTEGTLSLGNATAALQGVALTLGGGANDVNFTVAGATDGATFLTGGVTVAAGAGNVTLIYGGGTRSVVGGGLTLNKDVRLSSSNGPFAFGTITGTGGIYKTGAGVVQLNNSNSYAGGTTLSQGSLRLLNAGSLGSGDLVIGDSSTGAGNLGVSLGYNGTMTKNIHVTNEGTGLVTINNLNGVNNGNTATVAGTILLDRGIGIAASSNTGTNTNVNITALISGVGGVRTNSAAGTRVILQGANTYSGGTEINSGTLRTNNASALGTGQVAFSEVNTVTLDLNNTALGVQSLSGGSSTATVLTAGASGILTIHGGNVSAASFAGAITGAGGLIKNGAGVQILTGDNTFTGATLVNNGTLQLGSGAAVGLSGTSGVTIAGGTLVNGAGNSALGTGAVSMSSGAITPGGVGAVGSFTVAANQAFSVTGGTLNFDLLSSVSFDQILGSGTATFSLEDATLALSGLTSVGGSYQLFDGFGGTNDVSNLTITGLDAGWFASLDATGVLTVYAVPEPSTYASIAGVVLLGFAALRRRR